MKVEVFSVAVGPELFGFIEARYTMVARGDSDRRLCSLRRRSQSRERGRRRCIGAGRPGRKAKRVLQRNRCRRRPRSVDAGPAANFSAAFSTSPASRVSGVVPGRAAEASGFMPRDLNKSLDDRSTTRSKNVINFVSLGTAQAIAIKIGRGGAR